jgi:CubicO group peptidase (beta-lactamase class C family)
MGRLWTGASVGGRTRAFDRRPEVRRASIPSSGGVMNARSLARLYAMLASDGEWEGQRLLSQERLRQATAWVRRLPRSDILDHVASIGFADPRNCLRLR